jgi:hypothetical protein
MALLLAWPRMPEGCEGTGLVPLIGGTGALGVGRSTRKTSYM